MQFVRQHSPCSLLTPIQVSQCVSLGGASAWALAAPQTRNEVAAELVEYRLLRLNGPSLHLSNRYAYNPPALVFFT
jgi:hypothetical protein